MTLPNTTLPNARRAARRRHDRCQCQRYVDVASADSEYLQGNVPISPGAKLAIEARSLTAEQTAESVLAAFRAAMAPARQERHPAL